MSDDVKEVLKRLSERGTPRGADSILRAVEIPDYMARSSTGHAPRSRSVLALVACLAAALLGIGGLVLTRRSGGPSQSVANSGRQFYEGSGEHLLPSMVPSDLRLQAADHRNSPAAASLVVAGRLGSDGVLQAGIAAMTVTEGSLQALIKPHAPTDVTIGGNAAQVSESDGTPRAISVLRYTDANLGAIVLAGRNVGTDDLVRAANGISAKAQSISIAADRLPADFRVLYVGSTVAFSLVNNTSTDQLLYTNSNASRQLIFRTIPGPIDLLSITWLFPDARVIVDGARTRLQATLGSSDLRLWANGATGVSVSSSGLTPAELDRIVAGTAVVANTERNAATDGLPASDSGAAVASAPPG